MFRQEDSDVGLSDSVFFFSLKLVCVTIESKTKKLSS